MEGSKSKGVLLVMAWGLMVGITVLVDAQDLPPCANQLSPCSAYLNSTNPPNICCNPIKTIQNSCFCEFALAPSILQGFGIDTAQALQLVQLCGVNFDPTSCKASSPVGLPPSSVQPPATPGGDEGGAGRITFSGLSFLLFFWALMWFN